MRTSTFCKIASVSPMDIREERTWGIRRQSGQASRRLSVSFSYQAYILTIITQQARARIVPPGLFLKVLGRAFFLHSKHLKNEFQNEFYHSIYPLYVNVNLSRLGTANKLNNTHYGPLLYHPASRVLEYCIVFSPIGIFPLLTSLFSR